MRPLLAKAAKKKNANDKHIVGLACNLQDKQDAFKQMQNNINASQCILEVQRQNGSLSLSLPLFLPPNDIQIQAANKSRRVPNLRLAGVLLATKSPIQRVFQQGMENFATIQEPEAAISRFPMVSLQDLQANPPKSPSVHRMSHSWDAMTSIFRYSSNQNNRC